MPERILFVHDDSDFLEQAATALKLAGHPIASFTDPMAALKALGSAEKFELLITRVNFGSGKLNGVALARMARLKQPGIRVLFAALPETKEHTAGLGEFLPMPVATADLVEAVERLFRSLSQKPK